MHAKVFEQRIKHLHSQGRVGGQATTTTRREAETTPRAMFSLLSSLAYRPSSGSYYSKVILGRGFPNLSLFFRTCGGGGGGEKLSPPLPALRTNCSLETQVLGH